MRFRAFFSFDITIIIAVLILMVIGVLFIYSSGVSSSGVVISNEYLYQIVWIVLGLIVFFMIIISDYGKLKQLSVYIYFLCIFLLVLTLLLGKEVSGSRRWLSFINIGIQPSEFTKLGLTVLLASIYSDYIKKNNNLILFLICFLFALIPFVLVLFQPDLGTAMVYVPIFLMISYIAGIKIRYIIFTIQTALITIVFSVLPTWEAYLYNGDINISRIYDDPTIVYIIIGSSLGVILLSLAAFLWQKKKYFYIILFGTSSFILGYIASGIVQNILREYQLMRLIVFINPHIDPRGSGWHIIQSLTAIGSGGFWGKGYLQGPQSHLRFIPEQSTDFIFSILAEEWGFIGGFIVILLFTVIIIRGLFIVSAARDSFGTYLGVGILSMIFFHAIVNIGMAIGIMPITGIPLFFVSYGGSSLLTGLIGIALIQNIHMRRYK